VAPEDGKQIEAITGALARLVRRQADLEQRLARIETALHLAPPVTHAEPALPPEPAAPSPEKERPPAPPALDALAAQPEPDSRRLEAAFGLTWFSRIGAVTVVLALTFFFEYAFENHWITESGRVVVGLVCGTALLFAGERLWRGAQRTFAQALTAAGIAFFYLSVWAAFTLYHLIGQAAAFVLMVLVTAGAGALALRYKGLAIAVLSLSVGYATPLLLEVERNPWFVLSYALLLNLAAAVAARARRWRWLEGLAFAGTAILYAAQAPGSPSVAGRWLNTLFLCLSYAQFAAAPLQPLFVAAQVLAGLTLVEVWAPAAGVLALVLGIAGAGLAVADRRLWAAAVPASFAGFWMAYAQWRSVNPEAGSVLVSFLMLTVGFGIFLAWPLWFAGYRRRALRFSDLVVMALNSAVYFGATYSLLETAYGSYAGLFAVGAACVVALAAQLLWNCDSRGALLAGGMAWALLVLAAPIQFVGFRVTLVWSLEAAAIAWIGMRLQQRRALYLAGGVFLLVLLRLAFVDSVMYASPGLYRELVNARFLVFLVSALSLWAAAWWTRPEARLAVLAYLGGHAVLLWGLSLEVAGWAERTAAPENAGSVISTSISVLVAAYAVVLVAAGVVQRSAPTRVLGVALIGLVVLKLYLYDVWLLSLFYRMAAFAVLGALLLLMSYFYSRFRRSVETWWRP
jgi:Predicted membrane protein (DUF2339)